MSIGDFLEILSQQILVGTIFVGWLDVDGAAAARPSTPGSQAGRPGRPGRPGQASLPACQPASQVASQLSYITLYNVVAILHYPIP